MAEDVYFNKKANNDKNKDTGTPSFTEQIDEVLLNKSPGDMSFGKIVTENKTIKSHPPKADKSREFKVTKKRKKGTKAKKILIAVLLIFLSFAILLSAGVSYVLSDYETSEFSDNKYIENSPLLHSSSVYNILLMGIDTLNTEDSSRSDAMILMSLDMKNREIKLSSFLRDTYVYIPGIGNAKLNAACVYGGPQLVCDTIEYNFGIEIDDYAKVGYDMFIKIIDAVGGVTIPEIDEIEANALLKEGFQIEPATDVHLNGEQALKYCRIRKGQDDFYRTGRQREVISIVLKKLPLSNPAKLIKTAKDIAATIECSISKSEFSSLFIKAILCITGEIEQLTIPADGTWYNDTKNYQAVLVVDFEANKNKIEEFIYS